MYSTKTAKATAKQTMQHTLWSIRFLKVELQFATYAEWLLKESAKAWNRERMSINP